MFAAMWNEKHRAKWLTTWMNFSSLLNSIRALHTYNSTCICSRISCIYLKINKPIPFSRRHNFNIQFLSLLDNVKNNFYFLTLCKLSLSNFLLTFFYTLFHSDSNCKMRLADFRFINIIKIHWILSTYVPDMWPILYYWSDWFNKIR